MRKQVEHYLQEHHIDFQAFDHPALFTVEQAKERDHKIPGVATKNIFIRDKKKNFYLITLLASKKLETRIFKLQAGISDFSFATPEQLLEQLQLTPGSVGIFGLLNNPTIKLYIDQDIRTAPQAGRHPNDNTSTFVLDKQGFSDYLESLGVVYKIVIL